jgi:hypothetical protein
VPMLLAEVDAQGTDEGEAWQDLWGRLCHQGTVYEASYAAIPELAAMAARRAPTGYSAPLHLAAAIIGSTDAPEESAVVRVSLAPDLANLRDLAERHLAYAKGDVESVYALQALMAFEDAGVWQRNLEVLADGELTFDCPRCGDHLVIDLAGPDFAAASFDDASVAVTPVVPGDPSITSHGARMLALAVQHRFKTVVDRLPYLFGHVVCPVCRAEFDIPEALF